MTMDIAIRGGRVIDPANATDTIRDVLIRDGRIADSDLSAKAGLEVDASGCIVTPGLIDMHVHIHNGGTGGGFVPDMLPPLGVTAAVDAGSTGVDTFAAFGRSVFPAAVACFALMNVSSVGIPTEHWPENIDPQYFSPQQTRELMETFPGKIRGLKIRMSRSIAGSLELKPLAAALAMGDELGLPVIVHTSDPPRSAEGLVSMLRPGDVYAHCFNPSGSTMLDGNGRVKEEFYTARERGVIFDTSCARVHSAFPMVKAALDQGFYPDVLSTDLFSLSVYNPFVYGLPYVMTFFMAMGMDIVSAIRCATQSPASAMGLDGFGTLATNSRADVAIFRMEEKNMRVKDYYGNTTAVSQWLVPQLTVVKGKIAYRQMLFRAE